MMALSRFQARKAAKQAADKATSDLRLKELVTLRHFQAQMAAYGVRPRRRPLLYLGTPVNLSHRMQMAEVDNVG